MAFRDNGSPTAVTQGAAGAQVVQPAHPDHTQAQDSSDPLHTQQDSVPQPDQPNPHASTQDSFSQVSTQFRTSSPPHTQHDRIHALANRLIEIGQGINRTEDWAEYHTLTPSEWRELRILAEPTLEEYNLRPDYDPDRQELAIRMPTSRFHDKVGQFALEIIHRYLGNRIGIVETTGFLVEKAFHQEYLDCGEIYPDYALYKRYAKYPKLVLEVGFSNKPTPQLARDCIIKVSQGHTPTVVTVDLKHGNGAVEQHSITIYRLKLSTRTYKITSTPYILRDYKGDGTYTNHAGFVEFHPSDLGIASNNSFSIPFQEFLEAIDKAEDYQNLGLPVSPSPLEGKIEERIPSPSPTLGQPRSLPLRPA